MDNLKTTITGVIGGILTTLAHFGIVIPEAWGPVIIAVTLALLGFLAKDKPKTL
jgi:hypothetical protein